MPWGLQSGSPELTTQQGGPVGVQARLEPIGPLEDEVDDVAVAVAILPVRNGHACGRNNGSQPTATSQPTDEAASHPRG